jgi:hypothetical protein
MEDRADQLALEILAPITNVISLLRDRVSLPLTEQTRNGAGVLLRRYYGLPAAIAAVYARAALSELQSRRSVRQWLGAQ